MNVDFPFTTWKLGFLKISKYLARYGIQMDRLLKEGNNLEKRQCCAKLGLLCTIIKGRDQSDQESADEQGIILDLPFGFQ